MTHSWINFINSLSSSPQFFFALIFFVMLSCGVGVYSEDENDEEEEEAKKGTVIYFHAQPKSSDCEFSLKSIARKEEFKAGDWAGK